jgi:ComF family protein
VGFQTTLYYLREYFFPSGCGGCGEALTGAEDAYYGLCAECRAFFTAAMTGERRCEICGKPLISEKETCLSCREKSGAYTERLERLRALYPYEGKFRAVLAAYKFGFSLGVGNFLAESLAVAAENFGSLEKAAWVPVPPRPGKIKKQGWDQNEFLAKALAKNGGLSVCRCLKRLASRSQKELNREERGTNLKGRILCIKKPPDAAILFDDVVTTGATINACAVALLEGGAKKVYGVCLFYN